MQGILNAVIKQATAGAARIATQPAQPSQQTAPAATVPIAAIQQPESAPVAQARPIPQAAIPTAPISPQGDANALHLAKLERVAGALTG